MMADKKRLVLGLVSLLVACNSPPHQARAFARSFRLADFGDITGDSCSQMRKMARAVEQAGGGTIHLEDERVSSCALRIKNVPVTIEGDGIGGCALTFTENGDAGIEISEDDSHKRIVIRGCQFYSSAVQTGPKASAAIKITFPQTNAPDDAVTIDHIQVNTDGKGYFAFGIVCYNCTHHQFHEIDIQGIGIIKGKPRLSDSMAACIVLRGFSGNGKISDIECTNAIIGILESGKTEGTKVDNINMVAVNQGFVLQDGDQSHDPTSSPFTPGPQIENWHCDAYESCFTSMGWNQIAVHNFNFYKRGESASFWSGIQLLNGLYSSLVFPTTHSKFSFGRCAQNGSKGGSICFRLGSAAFANTISDIEPDGMDYFGDEGKTSRSNSVTRNSGFPQTNLFYPAQRSIYKAWRTNPSPLNYNLDNTPPVAGIDDRNFNKFETNSTHPNVGGFNIPIFHTDNLQRTTIENFDNGTVGDIIHVLATDDSTQISTGPRISSKSVDLPRLKKGEMRTFMFDGEVWRQQ